MPSSRRQISITGSTLAVSSRKVGSVAVARSTNRRTASVEAAASRSEWSSESGMPSDGTWKIASPGTPSASRLVARTRNAGHEPSSRSARSAAAPIRCSQLSTSNRRSFSRRKSVTTSISGWPGESGIPSARATSGRTMLGSLSGASSTSHVPSAKRPATSPATWTMRRVLPVPPTPTSDTSRFVSSREPIAATSRSRPMNEVSCAGRFDGTLPDRSGGNSDGRPGATSW